MRVYEQAGSTSNISKQRHHSQQMGFVPDMVSASDKERYDELVIDMLVQCAMPFNAVTHASFVALFKALRPAYVLPSRDVVRGRMHAGAWAHACGCMGHACALE